jgi:geranylgeranyl diphosphate synthase, type II
VDSARERVVREASSGVVGVVIVTIDLRRYLADCRSLAVAEIQRFIPKKKGRGDLLGPALYDLVLDYPLREAKGLRPALCLATCRALGGSEEAALPTAAVIELYHNAFLVHDDIEDGSEKRRDSPTLHREHGVPVAINVGDAMLALALRPLMDNTRHLGLGKALRILDVIAEMARETAEGQAIELDWVKNTRARLEVSDDDYREMVVKKTAWYSFIAPVTLGAIIAGASASQIEVLQAFARELGIAFQIRDDLLNLESDESLYGKELCGDLWEGKRTLMLLHMMREVAATSPTERERIAKILELRRPEKISNSDKHERESLEILLTNLETAGHLTSEGAARLRDHHDRQPPAPTKTQEDVSFLFHQIKSCGSITHATQICNHHASKARDILATTISFLPPSVHRDLLQALVDFTVGRDL